MLLCPKEHGGIVIMTAEVKGVKMNAIGQRRGPSVHTFLSTCGTFGLEVPARFPNIKNIKDAPYATLSLLNLITKAQPRIDSLFIPLPFSRQVVLAAARPCRMSVAAASTLSSSHFPFAGRWCSQLPALVGSCCFYSLFVPLPFFRQVDMATWRHGDMKFGCSSVVGAILRVKSLTRYYIQTKEICNERILLSCSRTRVCIVHHRQSVFRHKKFWPRLFPRQCGNRLRNLG